LYKHGLGYFERGGNAEASFVLEFPKRAMDDVLKSLVVIPSSAGAIVNSVAFETPDDRNADAQRQPIHLDAERPISGFIDAFGGHQVSVMLGDRQVDGELIGMEREGEEHLKRALLAIGTDAGVRLVPLVDVDQISLKNDGANADLAFALEAKRRDEERSYARVTLSQASEVHVAYIAPAPAWRVSYRVLVSAVDGSADGSDSREVFVQGWGLFDNNLEEDLEDVELTLTAGMPVSFRYELHQPNTPDRPVVRDESRTVSEPMEFAAMGAFEMADESARPAMMAAPAPGGSARARSAPKMSAASLAESAPVRASGESRGALFAYRIQSPVSVRRGESGMVPILSIKTKGERELLYNPKKNPENPVVSVRFKNDAMTLERGPAIVIDGGSYGGEAIVPFTPGGGELILAFAVELGVGVSSSSVTREEARSVRIVDGSLFVGVVEYIDTTYTAESQLDGACILTVEHPRAYNTELAIAPIEENVREARYKLTVPAPGQAELVVTEKRDRSHYQSVQGLDGFRLQQFLDGQLIDRAIFGRLQEILEMQARIQSTQQAIYDRDEERAKVRSRLEDARSNLAPLDAKQDSKLRERFLKHSRVSRIKWCASMKPNWPLNKRLRRSSRP
jgi:hypothetical protein